jgi:hypothetical protein
MDYIQLEANITGTDLELLSVIQGQTGEQYLKVPVAPLGEWSHPVYGKVSFTQQDFDDIVENFNEGKAGFDPPLFLGHPQSSEVLEGEPSEGWPDKLTQEGDVLFAYYSPTDEKLFEDVEKKRYRYASAEVLRNARDRQSGEKIGTLLVGLALTNRPFLPFKNHGLEVAVEKFSDSPGETDVSTPLTVFSFDLTPEIGNTSMSTKTAEFETSTNTQSQESSTHVAAAPTEVLSTPAAPSCPPSCPPTPPTDTVPREQYDKLAEDFSNLAKEFSTMKQQFSSLIEAEHSRAIELKLNKLNALNLPESTKQTFSDMIKSGTLTAAAEEKLFSDYQQLSENYKHVFAQPQGSSDEGRKGSTEVELPEFYSQIIERNNKIIEARGGNPSFQLL